MNGDPVCIVCHRRAEIRTEVGGAQIDLAPAIAKGMAEPDC